MSGAGQLDIIDRFCGLAFCDDTQEVIDDEACCAAADGVNAAWVRLLWQRSANEPQILRAGIGAQAFRQGPRGSLACADTPLAGLWTDQDHVLCDAAIVGGRLHVVDAPGRYRVVSCAVRDPGGDTVGLLEIGRFGDAYRDHDLTFLRTLSQCLAAASELCGGRNRRPAARSDLLGRGDD